LASSHVYPITLLTYHQQSAYDSPWGFRRQVLILVWGITWSVFCSWTPKPFNPWRLWILERFGASIFGRPFVHQRARIAHPWNLTLHHRACLGDGTNAYSLGPIILQKGATVAQEAYLCSGTHDFRLPARPLQTGAIVIGPHAFIGARAFVLPGITVGAHSIVGACSVVTRNVEPATTVVGNPARTIPGV